MLEEIQRARRHVDALRLALQSPSPEEMDRCLPALEEAVACLQSVEQELQHHSEKGAAKQSAAAEAGQTGPRQAVELPILQQLHSLNNELEIAQRLVIHGTAFCDTWSRMLGGATGGYLASGEAVPLHAPTQVSVKG